MTFNYAKTRGTAERLIARFGQVGAIRRETPGAGPPYSPGPPTVVNHPAKLVVTSFTAREIDGTRIRADDLKVLVAAEGLAVEPTTLDRVVEAQQVGSPNGPSLAIVNVEPLSPAGMAVVFTLQCRR